MSGLAPYLSPEALASRTESVAARLGAELVVYGDSVQGRPLRAIRIRGPGSSRPRILCSANIHGPEFIGGLTALALAESVARGDWQPQAELWVIPCLNPDGYVQTWARGGEGPLSTLRTNANGVDLNRNFPRPADSPSWLPGAGSTRPGDATYRGAHPLSEPETAQLDALLAQQKFSASANLHSFMGTVIPASVRDRASFSAYKGLASALAAGQRHTRYRRLSARVLDVYTGEQEDHQHHVHRTWAVCVESFPLWASYRQHRRAPSTFWRFNPRDPQHWIDNDVPGLHAYFEHALALDRPPARSPGRR
ncbi:MAG: M14 family metallopeptidase [Nannocystaceae bacterium]|nr:M14 family metallopeptidase [bacterium]